MGRRTLKCYMWIFYRSFIIPLYLTDINNLPRLDIINMMLDHPNLEEIQKNKSSYTRKAPGLDGILVKELLHWDDSLLMEIHHMIWNAYKMDFPLNLPWDKVNSIHSCSSGYADLINTYQEVYANHNWPFFKKMHCLG